MLAKVRSRMRRLFSHDGPLPPVLLPLGGALLALAVARGPAQAEPVSTAFVAPKASLRALAKPAAPVPAKTKTFFISQKDGYGLSDCLTNGEACGRVVADSWCSAHGWGAAMAWGSTNDMTASVAGPAKATPKDHIAVTCAE